MKILPLLLTVALLQVKAESSAQITLKLDNVSLYRAMISLTEQSGIDFTFGERIKAKDVKISINISNASLETAMSKLLEGTQLGWQRVHNTVVLFVKNNQPSSPAVPADTSIGRTVSGKVYSITGEPLSGASVRINGTERGTMTGTSGDFILGNVGKNDILTVTYTGYTSTSEQVRERVVFNFYLQRSVKELDRIIIQGYGTTSKRLATGNITTITAEEISRNPVMNVLEALKGKAPGLLVTQSSGYASAPVKLELRGRSALNLELPSEPLIIVDGVPLTVIEQNITSSYESGSRGFIQNNLNGPANGQSPLFSVNPDDIESISVLKDADATAIYGSRGGRGVILVTTKKGKAGKTSVDANIYSGVNFVTQYYDMLNTSDYINMRREAFKNGGIEPTTTNAYDFLVWDSTRYTNWQRVYWGSPGINTDAEISISGGDRNNSFRVSGGYHRQKGLNSYSGADTRSSVNLAFGHKSDNQKFSFDIRAIFSNTKSNNITLGGGVTLAPTAPKIFNENGSLNYAGWEPAKYYFTFGSLLRPYEATTNFLNGNIRADYNILKTLKSTVSLGYSSNDGNQWSTNPISSQDPATNPKGSAQFGSNSGRRFIVEPMLEYKSFHLGGRIEAVAGATYQKVNQSFNYMLGRGYVSDNQLKSMSFAPTKDVADGRGQYKYAAIFARINYNLYEKYIITLSGRRDGSSKFGPSNRFGNFGSIAGAWLIGEETFMKKLFPSLSFGKIRASYGIIGSDNIGDYNYLSSWLPMTQFQGTTATAPSRHFNSELQWQVDRKFEVGVELGFLNDRLSVNLSYYRNRSGNQLLPDFILPLATGFGGVSANFPALVQNSGFEPVVTAQIIKSNNLTLTTTIQAGFNRNRLISFPGIENSSYFNTYAVGMPLNIRKVLKSTGVNPQTGEYEFEDINKDGSINSSLGKLSDNIWKTVQVDYDGSVAFDLGVKNFQLNALFHFRRQIGKNALTSIFNPGTDANVPVELFQNRWVNPGDNAKYARFTTVPNESDFNFRNSDGMYTDASFIRLNNISASYNIPKKVINKWKINNVKVYIKAQNLIVITNYIGSDPETQVFGNLPPLTSVVGGLQISL